jgi:broad specificity phosphatase PhoE
MGWLEEGIEPGWVRAAAAVADVLVQEPVGWLVSSPFARAVQTAAPLAARLGRQPIVDDRFGELRVGHWEGDAEDEIAERWPEQWQRWRSAPHALEVEGQTWPTYTTRVAGALEQLFAELVDGRVAVVFTRDAVVRAAGAWALGTGPRGLSACRGRQLLAHHGRGGRRCGPAGADERERPPRGPRPRSLTVRGQPGVPIPDPARVPSPSPASGELG